MLSQHRDTMCSLAALMGIVAALFLVMNAIFWQF
jgi:hypothetical protein